MTSIVNGFRAKVGAAVDTVVDTVEAKTKAAVDTVKSAADSVKTGALAIKDSFEAGVESTKNILVAGATAAKETVVAGVETVKHAVGVGVDVAKGAVEAVAAPFDKAWLARMQQMDSAGDSFTATLGVGGSLKGVKLEGEAELQVKRNSDNTYSVVAGGKLGAGLSAKLIEKPGATLKAEATLSAGAKVEYKFNSPEDAAKAARILSLKAAASAVGTAPVAGALGTGYQMVSKLSGDDKFLSDNMASVTFSAELSGKLKAELGIPDLKLGGGLDAKAAVGSSMRLEFNNGKPALVVASELSGEFGGNVKAREALKLEGSVKGKITAEQRYELSGLADFSKNPVEALRQTFSSNRPEGKESLSLSLEGKMGAKLSGQQGGLSGSDTGNITLSMSGKPGEIYNSQVLTSLVQLDLVGAAKLLGDTPVSLKVSTVETTGLDFKQGLGAIGTGVDVKVAAQQRNSTEVFSEKTTLREVPTAIANAWNQR